VSQLCKKMTLRIASLARRTKLTSMATTMGTHQQATMQARIIAKGARQVHTVRTTAIRVVEIRTSGTDPKNNKSFSPLKRFFFGTGLVLFASGIAYGVASGRATRQSIGLAGSGAAIALSTSPFLSPAAISALVVGVTGVSVLSVHLHDERERNMQIIVRKALEETGFPENVRFDDGGPEPHAISRPKYEVLVGLLGSIVSGQKQEVKVRLSGYSVRPDGDFDETVAFAYATKDHPLSEWKLSRVDVEPPKRVLPPLSVGLVGVESSGTNSS